MAIVIRVHQQGLDEPARSGKSTSPFNLKSAAKAKKKPDPADPHGKPIGDGKGGPMDHVKLAASSGVAKKMQADPMEPDADDMPMMKGKQAPPDPGEPDADDPKPKKRIHFGRGGSNGIRF